MKKNKFNIGQTVIVLDNSKVTEKIVDGIREDNGDLLYNLKGLKKRPKHKFRPNPDRFSVRMGFGPSRPLFGRDGIAMPYFIDDVDKEPTKFIECFEDYKESDIYENEADFRANIKVHTLPKRKSKKKAA